MKQLITKYLGNIYFPIVWTLFVAFLLCIPGTMLPSESHFFFSNFDKLVHICLFGGFVLFWDLYLSKRNTSSSRLLRLYFLVFILGNVFGIGMEFMQKYYIPFRDFDTEDIIADMIGTGLGYGVSNIYFIK